MCLRAYLNVIDGFHQLRPDLRAGRRGIDKHPDALEVGGCSSDICSGSVFVRLSILTSNSSTMCMGRPLFGPLVTGNALSILHEVSDETSVSGQARNEELAA